MLNFHLSPRRIYGFKFLYIIFELTLNILFLVRLKLPAKPLSPNVGPALRKSLSIISDRLYNYDFGPST